MNENLLQIINDDSYVSIKEAMGARYCEKHGLISRTQHEEATKNQLNNAYSPFRGLTIFDDSYIGAFVELAERAPKAHSLLYVLLEYMKESNSLVCSVDSLAKMMDLKRHIVLKSIKTLEEWNLLTSYTLKKNDVYAFFLGTHTIPEGMTSVSIPMNVLISKEFEEDDSVIDDDAFSGKTLVEQVLEEKSKPETQVTPPEVVVTAQVTTPETQVPPVSAPEVPTITPEAPVTPEVPVASTPQVEGPLSTTPSPSKGRGKKAVSKTAEVPTTPMVTAEVPTAPVAPVVTAEVATAPEAFTAPVAPTAPVVAPTTPVVTTEIPTAPVAPTAPNLGGLSNISDGNTTQYAPTDYPYTPVSGITPTTPQNDLSTIPYAADVQNLGEHVGVYEDPNAVEQPQMPTMAQGAPIQEEQSKLPF